jgi:hypothetical protein
MEVNALVVYNGKLYAGSIPRAEVYRYEGGQEWTRMARFFAPPGWEPEPVATASPQGVAEWTRVTSLTVYAGRLFASIASCTGAIIDAPCDVRGEVYALQAGRCITYDRDLGASRRHLMAVRDGANLSLYIDGELAVTSADASQDEYAIDNSAPLTIGFGTEDHFSGQIQDVRIYDGALTAAQVRAVYEESRSTHSAG